MRLDLVSDDSYERGYAHGYLLAKEIVEFGDVKMPEFYVRLVLDSFDVTQFPEPVQEILRVIQLKGAKAAPEVFAKALNYVWNREKDYHPAYLIEEMNGIAAGLCASPLFSKSGNGSLRRQSRNDCQGPSKC